MAEDWKRTYSEKLKDPRWQKKRLAILDRDGWKCTNCDATDKTLHVHHEEYRWGADPWDYSDEKLTTLCFECHELQTQFDRDLRECEKTLIENLRQCSFYNRLMVGPLLTAEVLEAVITNLIQTKFKKKDSND